MKNTIKWFAIIAIIAVIGFSMAACGGDDGTNPQIENYTVTYNGNAHTGGTVPTDSTPYPSGATVTVLGNNGNLAKTGNTFAGWNTAANGSGASYNAGSTFTIYANTTLYAQWTPVGGSTQSLDGIWEAPDGTRVTVSGNTGVYSVIGSAYSSGYMLDAVNKGYVAVGNQVFRNLTSSGNLTWTGQFMLITYNTSNPNVATGTSWANRTFTMSADGKTLQTFVSGSTTPENTFTRKQ